MELSFVPKRYREAEKSVDYSPGGMTREGPTIIPAVIPRRMSEAAAAAAEHVVNLEQEIENLRLALNVERNRADRAEAACENLHEDLAKVREERDRYQRHAIDIRTRLNVAGKVILDAMADPVTRELAIRQTETAAVAAVEQAVKEINQSKPEISEPT